MTSHYQSMHAAVKMLISRITLLHETVQKMETGVPLLHASAFPLTVRGMIAAYMQNEAVQSL